MRIANINGRSALVLGRNSYVDVYDESSGRFPSDPQALYARWDELRAWSGTVSAAGARPIDNSALRAPAPSPRQVIAVGFNYGEHVKETGFERPSTFPPIFTKFVSSFTGPYAEVTLPAGGQTDWEVELVAIMGATTSNVDESDAWNSIAALTVGQDLSERKSQFAGQGSTPQFSYAKSFSGFAPMGPWAVSVDEFEDPTDLRLTCAIDGETVQDGRTTDMIFPVAALVSGLSRQLTLYAGDVIFTGTPAGVGFGMDPKRFLRVGEVLTTEIEGIGVIEQRLVG